LWAATNALAMEADVNIAFPGVAAVPTFWDIDLGGCNPLSLLISTPMPVTAIVALSETGGGAFETVNDTFSLNAPAGRSI